MTRDELIEKAVNEMGNPQDWTDRDGITESFELLKYQDKLRSLFVQAFDAGESAEREELTRYIRHPKHQKEYKEGENALARENKSGWNHCLQYIIDDLSARVIQER